MCAREVQALYNAGKNLPEIPVVNLFQIKLALSCMSLSFSSHLNCLGRARVEVTDAFGVETKWCLVLNFFFGGHCILYSKMELENRKSEGNIRNSQIQTV